MIDFVISNVPAVVDPATAVLELFEHLTDGKTTWTHLYRLDIPSDASVPTPVVGRHNVYGPHENWEDCNVMLAYDVDGYISAVFTQDDDGDWERLDMGEEVSGRPPLSPSIRFLVPTMDKVSELAGLWREMKQQQRDGECFSDGMANEFLRLLLEGDIPPRLINVRQLQKET